MTKTLQVELLDENKNVKSLKHIEKNVVETIFKKNDFNITKTCRELKISRHKFYNNYRDLIEDDGVERKKQINKNRRKRNEKIYKKFNI